MSRILLLETDKILANNISHCLEAAGHRVDWQVDPQEAIISLDLSPADAVIIDIMLAGRSGIEFLYELRSYEDWQRLPVFIYSQIPKYELDDSLPGLVQLGISEYLSKILIPPNKLASIISQKLQISKV